MPDLGNLLNSSSVSEIPSPNSKPIPNVCEPSSSLNSDWDKRLRFPIHHEPEICKNNEIKVLKRCRSKVGAGVSERKRVLPFLGPQKLVECRICHLVVSPGTELPCSVHGCEVAYHLKCAEQSLRASSSRKFKCPRHACYLCKQKFQLLRCVKCEFAWHVKCAAFPEHVMQLHNQPGKAICWKHPTDWHQENKLAAPINSIEEVFGRLPVPYVVEEFDIDSSWKYAVNTEKEPTPYVHIRRNIYLVKRKRDDDVADIGCTSCISSVCSDSCVCRVQCISCSKACACSDMCTNRPFRKEKQIKVVKTERCGWGVEAAEPIKEGDFIIEYVGEVISDALCEERLWDMKHMGIQNFYMCEIRKDFTIDATFKGNSSRFLNHSCDPNCNLEKWQLDGETRIGVFAARSIQSGEPLTYNYRFIQFGDEVKCQCGASNCQGYLGAKRKAAKVILSDWGSKANRSSRTRRNNYQLVSTLEANA